jgi:quercetin dioxygenase-like cupin family protein
VKVIKRKAGEIKKEEAHGGSGSRKVYASNEHLKGAHFDVMTHGFLPAGKSFDWHEHNRIEEIMVVIKGDGRVHDEDGKYEYAPGDVFVFPANTKHKIHNPTSDEHEMIFVRVKT